jgi:flagellar biogenesis protein FliO
VHPGLDQELVLAVDDGYDARVFDQQTIYLLAELHAPFPYDSTTNRTNFQQQITAYLGSG